jgi:hypothetical protein
VTSPQDEIDHVNGVRDDNRIANLRVVQRRDNLLGQAVRKDSKSGTKGVSFQDGKWRAGVKIDGRMRTLGRFSTKEAARDAFRAAEKDRA